MKSKSSQGGAPRLGGSGADIVAHTSKFDEGWLKNRLWWLSEVARVQIYCEWKDTLDHTREVAFRYQVMPGGDFFTSELVILTWSDLMKKELVLDRLDAVIHEIELEVFAANRSDGWIPPLAQRDANRADLLP